VCSTLGVLFHTHHCSQDSNSNNTKGYLEEIQEARTIEAISDQQLADSVDTVVVSPASSVWF
jgi:hypothetical protein